MTQLSALGRADVDTVIRPSLTFWKTVMRKHTNFAMEPKRADPQSIAGYGRRNVFKLQRQGDLICKAYWYLKTDRVNAGAGGAYLVEDFGRAIIDDTTDIQVGNVQYDRLFSEAEHAWEEMNTPQELMLGKLTGKSQSIPQLVDWAKFAQHFYIPLPFWFHTDFGNAFPMIASYMTDVTINITTKSKANLIKGFGAPYVVQAADAEFLDSYLILETVFLDDSERKFFVESELKYVITQNQTLGTTTLQAGLTTAKIDLHFNQPCKMLYWVLRSDTNTTALNWFNFSGPEVGEFLDEAFKSATITLNNNNRFDLATPYYLRQVQQAQHCTRIANKHVYTYNFSLYPADSQPSGTVNFSRIDTSRLILNWTSALPEGYTAFVFTKSINTFSCKVLSLNSVYRFGCVYIAICVWMLIVLTRCLFFFLHFTGRLMPAQVCLRKYRWNRIYFYMSASFVLRDLTKVIKISA